VLLSQAHSFRQQARLAITLAWVAGYTNILTVLVCGTVTSHVTGTVSQWGRDLVEGKWSLLWLASFLLVTFVVGAMISGVCIEAGKRRLWKSIYVLPMALQSVLLATFATLLTQIDLEQPTSGVMLYVLSGLASVAMGLQNATITMISGGVVRTTHMTGVFTDIGTELVHFIYWLADTLKQKSSGDLQAEVLFKNRTARRIALLVSVAGSFALGAGLGALAFGHYPAQSMIPPVMFLLWIIVMDVRIPISEVSLLALDEHLAAALPGSMAVYHLRGEQKRVGEVHHLPDLQRWSEGLPESLRVIILDISGVNPSADRSTQQSLPLDSDAGLELASVLARSKAANRHLLISGLSPMQFEHLRRLPGGEVFNPANVCPDLELAIARGIHLLDL
jgi:uncharacterized membrane protein YoaK (UPF0700 family)